MKSKILRGLCLVQSTKYAVHIKYQMLIYFYLCVCLLSVFGDGHKWRTFIFISVEILCVLRLLIKIVLFSQINLYSFLIFKIHQRTISRIFGNPPLILKLKENSKENKSIIKVFEQDRRY